MDKSQDLVIKSNSSKLGNWPLLTHSGKKKLENQNTGETQHMRTCKHLLQKQHAMHKNTIKGTPTSQDSMLKIWQTPGGKTINEIKTTNHEPSTCQPATTTSNKKSRKTKKIRAYVKQREKFVDRSRGHQKLIPSFHELFLKLSVCGRHCSCLCLQILQKISKLGRQIHTMEPQKPQRKRDEPQIEKVRALLKEIKGSEEGIERESQGSFQDERRG